VPAPSDTPAGGISNPSATPDAIPVLDPKGTALQNLAYFKAVLHPLLDKKPNASGKSIIDALAHAGFSKKQMEVTADKTSIGLDADNKSFSVRINGTCIVGQSGDTGFHSFAMALLSTGHCLVGKTRAIDW
jgi:hypothetical protein